MEAWLRTSESNRVKQFQLVPSKIKAGNQRYWEK